METYQYHRLSGNDRFRLVSLDAPDGGGDIRCSLSEFRVGQAPVYEALSYVWGDLSMTCRLYCDGLVLPITATLETALRRIQYRDASRLLWIDQICIDQSNIEERNEQVQAMRSVYQQATKVLLWLGSATDAEAQPAFELIDQIKPWLDNIVTRTFPSDEELAIRGLPPRKSPQWHSLQRLCEVQYFNRIWVIQEVLVASSATLMWGRYEVDLAKFQSAMLWLADSGCSLSGAFVEEKTDRCMNFLGVIGMCSCQQRGTIKFKDFLSLLWSYQERGVTDPRDKSLAFWDLLHTILLMVGRLLR